MRIDYDAIAKEYALHRQVHPGVLQKLLQSGHITSNNHVLDVGCGTGNYLLALHQAVGCVGWGVEPSEQMIQKAKEQCPIANLKITTAETLNFPVNMFDLVYSVDVIHHIQDKEAYFKEAIRIIKNNGAICTVTDSADIIRRRQPLAKYFPETIDVELQRYPPIIQLTNMMKACGFHSIREEVVEYSYQIHNLQAYVDKAFSSLHLISNEAFEKGIQYMKNDLLQGPIQGISRYLLLWGKK